MKYGLLGEKLSHSLSPEIHSLYGNDDYNLFEVPPGEVKDFVLAKKYQGLNVTIPYKEIVLDLCDEISERAEKIGSVNTVIQRHDGSLYGDNTDYQGFLHMAAAANIDFTGKKVVILGQGGTGKTAKAAISRKNPREIVVVSRTGPVTYDDIDEYFNGDILVNTTPVGMYPHNGDTLVDLDYFPNLEGVIDVIYNPLRTALILQAEEEDIPCTGGLPMLTEQARAAAELFLNKKISPEKGEEVYEKMRRRFSNIVIVGNESVALALGQEIKRPVVTGGDWQNIAKEKSLILSVTREDAQKYYRALRQNGVLIPAHTIKKGKAWKIQDILRSL